LGIRPSREHSAQIIRIGGGIQTRKTDGGSDNCQPKIVVRKN